MESLAYNSMSHQEKRALKQELEERLKGFRAEKLSLDMTRGKPNAAQLDLSSEMLTIVGADTCLSEDNVDLRNYGLLDGISDAKKLLSEYLEVSPREVIIGGNSSLRLMYDTIAQCVTHGTVSGDAPWSGKKTKFICPVPGYDRHFSICEHFGIEMVPVEMGSMGPDMEEVERIAGTDDAVRGMWCVPKYHNPTGYVYSDEVVERLASMKTAARDFLLFWDNAYQVHHLGGGPAPLRNILDACKKAGNAERVMIFGSTAKIAFPAGSLAVAGGSEAAMEWVRKRLFVQTIGPDKLNMARHVRFFRNMDGILAHMEKHAAILSPKFQAVQEILAKELSGKGLATWTEPQGGYFVSVDTIEGCATKAVALASDCGVKFTQAGATFPYKDDPRDRNIRIAPTFPSLQEIRSAVEVLAVCIQYGALEMADGVRN